MWARRGTGRGPTAPLASLLLGLLTVHFALAAPAVATSITATCTASASWTATASAIASLTASVSTTATATTTATLSPTSTQTVSASCSKSETASSSLSSSPSQVSSRTPSPTLTLSGTMSPVPLNAVGFVATVSVLLNATGVTAPQLVSAARVAGVGPVALSSIASLLYPPPVTPSAIVLKVDAALSANGGARRGLRSLSASAGPALVLRITAAAVFPPGVVAPTPSQFIELASAVAARGSTVRNATLAALAAAWAPLGTAPLSLALNISSLTAFAAPSPSGTPSQSPTASQTPTLPTPSSSSTPIVMPVDSQAVASAVDLLFNVSAVPASTNRLSAAILSAAVAPGVLSTIRVIAAVAYPAPGTPNVTLDAISATLVGGASSLVAIAKVSIRFPAGTAAPVAAQVPSALLSAAVSISPLSTGGGGAFNGTGGALFSALGLVSAGLGGAVISAMSLTSVSAALPSSSSSETTPLVRKLAH